MAVPCVGAKVIFEAVLKSFASISYPHIAPNIEPMIHPAHIELYNSTATGQLRVLEKYAEYRPSK
jgi:hypothetical protein